jgi:hypothetical protein
MDLPERLIGLEIFATERLSRGISLGRETNRSAGGDDSRGTGYQGGSLAPGRHVRQRTHASAPTSAAPT